jgi:catechol 2,3-dioxygenase-like lactoylglutathione lyase family enzyme
VALVAGDIQAMWSGLEKAKPETITAGAPVLLPPNTGGVTAFKFRDLEGHPLELISFPAGVGDSRWQQGGTGIRGFDHTAIVATDLDRSLAFYTELLGMRIGGRSLNQGPEQDRLDRLTGCVVDVVALQPVDRPTPHLELLHYRSPPSAAPIPSPKANDVASVRQVHRVDNLDALVSQLTLAGAPFVSHGPVAFGDGVHGAAIRDPDGHMIVLLD